MKRAQQGEPLNIPAADYNRFVDAAENYLRNRNLKQPAKFNPTDLRAVLLVRNDSSQQIPRFGVMGIDGPVFDPAEQLLSFQNYPVLRGNIPNEEIHQGRFVITLQPIAPTTIGYVLAAGVVQVQIQSDDESVMQADILNGVTEHLQAINGGAASILWRDNGQGVKWALIRFGGGGGVVSGAGTWVIVRLIPAQADPAQSTALWLWVERAVKAPGHDDAGQENYGLFTGRGPREPDSTPPSQGYDDPGDVERWLMGWEKMRIHPHTFARHYLLMRWPSGAPVSRETDILKAEFMDGEWRVLLPFGRIWNDQLDPATAVGDCRPQAAGG